MNTKKLWLVITCLLAAFAIIGWRLAGPAKAVRLSDGTTLRLLGVTTGTNWFTTERAWHSWARKTLPLRYQGWIPQPKRAMQGSLNGARYWFELSAKTGVLSGPVWGRAETASGDGEVLDSECYPQQHSQHGLFSIGMQRLPRREPTFRWRVYGTNHLLLGEIRLPNPFRGPFPNWTPDQLPATHTNGDLTATLKSVRKLMQKDYFGWLNTTRTSIHWRTDIEFRWRGDLTTNWELGSYFATDATGNWIDLHNPRTPTSEKVWCWHTSMQPRPESPVALNERFIITNLPVPLAGTWTLINIITNIQEFDFWIGAWCGPSAITLSNGYPFQIAPPLSTNDWHQLAWSSSIRSNNLTRPTLVAAIRDNGSDILARVAFRDQNGRLLRMEQNSHDHSSGSYMQLRAGRPWVEGRYFRPMLDENVRSIDLEVTVQRRLKMSFFITPPREGEWIGERGGSSAR